MKKRKRKITMPNWEVPDWYKEVKTCSKPGCDKPAKWRFMTSKGKMKGACGLRHLKKVK